MVSRRGRGSRAREGCLGLATPGAATLGDVEHDLADAHGGGTCQGLGAVAELDQRLSPTEPAERHEVGIVEPFADLDGLHELGERTSGIAFLETSQTHRYEQVATLGAVQVAFVDQLLGPGQPALSASRLGPC